MSVVVEALKNLLARAEAGEITEVAFAAVRSDGNTSIGRAPDNCSHTLAAAVGDLAFSIHDARAGAYETPAQLPDGMLENT